MPTTTGGLGLVAIAAAIFAAALPGADVSVAGGAGGGVGLTNGGTTGDVAFDLAPVITWLFLTDCLVLLAPSEEPPLAPLFAISVSINPFFITFAR